MKQRDIIKFGVRNYFKRIPDFIKRLVIAVKTLTASGVAFTIYEHEWKNAMIIAGIGFACNEILMLFGATEDVNAAEEARDVIKEKVYEVTEEIKNEQTVENNDDRTEDRG